MNAASEFDLGPLTWVRSEIDLALERATEALALYAGSNDVTHLKFARMHIHQANGALALVGLDGVTHVVESLEALLVLLEEGQSTAGAPVFDALEESLGALSQYLDDLLAGAPNQPLRLLPAYEALAKARGLNNSHAADLFYPDLSPRPGNRTSEVAALDAEAQKTLIKSERARYQKALLAFLKKPEETAQAIASLRQAVSAIEAIQDTPANRVFWWISLGFIDTLNQPEIAADPRARQLCSHIDGQIRRLLEGTRTVAERLLRDALYFIATTPGGQHPLVDEINAAFHLQSLLPGATPASAAQPHESALRRLREALTASEEAWNKFCAGNGSTLGAFAEHARLCSALCNDISYTDLKRLGQAFAATANWLAETPSRQSDSIAMEVATAILLLQSAIDNFRELGTDFARQVDLMVARLYGCIAGKTQEEHALPSLDEMSRRAQERLLITQVVREIQNNLAQLEQTLDAFFRNPEKSGELAAAGGPLKQIGGALAMLGHFGAVHSLKQCSAQVKYFAEPDYVPANADFEALARQLSLLGFFVDALQHGETSYEAFVARMEDKPAETSHADIDAELRGSETLIEAVSASAPAPVAPVVKQPVETLVDLPEITAEPVVEESPLPEAAEEDEKLSVAANALADLLIPEEPVSANLSRSTAESSPIPPGISASPTLYDIFLEEARGHLQTLINGLAELEATPDMPTAFAMMRAAHTLGGTAATVGLMPLNHLAIALEHALLRRDGSVAPAGLEGLATLRLAIEKLEAQFTALAEQQAPEEQPPLIAALADIYPPAPAGKLTEASSVSAPELPLLNDDLDEQLLPFFLEEAQDQLRDLNRQLAAWCDDPAQSAAPYAIARLLHTFKGNARMAGAMNLGEFTHLLEARIEEIARQGKITPALLDEIQAGFDALAVATDKLRPGKTPAAPTGEAAANKTAFTNDSSLRVPAKLIDQLVSEAGELSIARTRIEGEMRSLKGSLLDLTENVIRLRNQLREIEIQAEGQIQARVAQTPDGEAQFDPLELDRLTRFQELTRLMAESLKDVATVQQNLLRKVDDANAAILAQSRLNRNLQQELMGMRMLPFASQSERLYRIVRQTAKDVGKRANLDIVGSQVEMDRSVLDKMQGPLEHMLRNAVTHGIESRAERAAAGKPETGEITISVSQEGNEIMLSMVDDGKGLDSKAIRARAESLELLKPGQKIDDRALFDFIFQPGFSTASEVSQVSGRGVGMDVVKTEVTALGGRIEIISTAGEGTTFRLYLPLTLAVMQILLLRTGANLYAIPSSMIEQVLELKEKPLTALREKGEAEWLGNRYPFHFLPNLLGDTEAHPEAHRQYRVLLLRSGSQRVAVQVDELRGNQEVVVKNIGAQLAGVVGIDGATVLGDGKVVLILNPVALASKAGNHGLQAEPVTVVEPTGKTLPSIMVVDDSLTVRKITSRLLAREGYQVILAKDGVDALAQLADITPDVILSDIEMPRMDGFDLLRNLRVDERLAKLPVIMITSRTADKQRNHAFELGASHYLGKPYDEDELLKLIAGYTVRS